LTRVFLDRVTKVFKTRRGIVEAVKNVTIEIKPGEFFAIIGPSGCGKTTTLRMIAGLEIPTEGRVFIGDRDVTFLPPKERDVGMVFQSYAIYPHMKVYDNIAFPLKIRKVSEEEIRKKVTDVAKVLSIAHLLDRTPSELSGGEMQRVAVARALVREPRVLLLDEPLSNLDAQVRVTARAFLKRLQRELNITTVYVTHDQSEAMVLGDRIAIMNYGEIQQIGTPFEIYRKPANMFVATFVGSPPTNLIPGSIIEKNGKMIFDAGAFQLSIPDNIASLIKEKLMHTEVVLGIRPEDINAVPYNEGLSICGAVYVTEYLATHQWVTIAINNIYIKAYAPAEAKINIGDKMCIAFDANKMYLFDKKSQKSLMT
jgi:multiple sugar transport system ATP-binding protein